MGASRREGSPASFLSRIKKKQIQKRRKCQIIPKVKIIKNILLA
jgi:hypothetical protein